MDLIRPPDSRDGWYRFTPESSARLLAEAKAEGIQNRRLSAAGLDRLSADMSSGDYTPNGESMVFSDRGFCIDGQHRLQSCVTSGSPFISYVVFVAEVTDRVIESFNCGKTRTNANRLGMRGVKHEDTVGSLIRKLVQYDHARASGFWPRGFSISARTFLRVQEDHAKEIDAACEVALRYSSALRGLVAPSMVALTYFQAARLDEVKAQEFIHKLASGEALEPLSPILLLRRRLVQDSTRKARLPEAEVVALCITAWNAFHAGRLIKVLKWTSGTPFPVFTPKAEEAE